MASFVGDDERVGSEAEEEGYYQQEGRAGGEEERGRALSIGAISASHLTARLREQLKLTREELEKWAGDTNGQLDRTRDTHMRGMQECAETIEALHNAEKELDEKAREFDQQQGSQDDVLAKKREAVQELRSLASQQLPVKMQQLEGTQAKLSKLLAEKRTEAAQRQGLREEQVNELTRGVNFFKFLGLEFENTEPSEDKDATNIRMVFTQIDPSLPERRFSFIMGIQTESYTVVSCEPPLGAPGELESLLKDLNSSNDLSTFVRGMRRGFQAVVARERGGEGEPRGVVGVGAVAAVGDTAAAAAVAAAATPPPPPEQQRNNP